MFQENYSRIISALGKLVVVQDRGVNSSQMFAKMGGLCDPVNSISVISIRLKGDKAVCSRKLYPDR